MSVTAVARRPFDPERDAHRFVYLTDGELLFEVVAVRGFPRADSGPKPALRLLDVARPIPKDRFEELDSASWVPIEEVAPLDVVTPMRNPPE